MIPLAAMVLLLMTMIKFGCLRGVDLEGMVVLALYLQQKAPCRGHSDAFPLAWGVCDD